MEGIEFHSVCLEENWNKENALILFLLCVNKRAISITKLNRCAVW